MDRPAALRNTAGFTLIELLIVMTIIGILAGVLIPNLLGARNAAHDGSAKIYLRNCISAMESSRDHQGFLQNISTCEDPLLNNGNIAESSSVESSQVVITPDRTDYSISVTGRTGKIFKYEKGIISAS